MRFDAGTRKQESSTQALHAEANRLKANVVQYERDIQRCKELAPYDPYKAANEVVGLQHKRSRDLGRLGEVLDEIRNRRGPNDSSDEWRPASSSYFHSSDS
jgi:hypothetical protein